MDYRLLGVEHGQSSRIWPLFRGPTLPSGQFSHLHSKNLQSKKVDETLVGRGTPRDPGNPKKTSKEASESYDTGICLK